MTKEYKTFTIKASIAEDLQKCVNFYTKEHTLTHLLNELLLECEKNKSFKFKILKQLNLKYEKKEKLKV